MQRSLASVTTSPDACSFVEVTFDVGSANSFAAHPVRPAPEDKRSSPRRRVLLSALVVNQNLDAIFRCRVRDVSELGARLQVPEGYLLPSSFWLIAASAGLAYDARTAWRRYPDIGISVGEPIDLRDPTNRVGRQLRAFWLALHN